MSQDRLLIMAGAAFAFVAAFALGYAPTIRTGPPGRAVALATPKPTPLAPFGELTALTSPPSLPLAEAPSAPLEDLGPFTAAANLYRTGATAQGDAAAGAIADPLQRAALDWIALRVNATPARVDAFEKAHPDWPLRDWLRAQREAWLYSGKPSPQETLAAFAGAAPSTPQGRVAMARALMAEGRREEGEALVRALWREGDLDGVLEAQLLREFGALLTREDHVSRASRLLYAEHGTTAWRAAALAGPDALALASARIEAARGPLSARASGAVPPAMRADPGYLFAHVQDARRSGRYEEAESWLKLAPREPEKLVDPDKWWSERRMVARGFLDKGEYESAYRVASGAVEPRSSPARVDAAFHAGWIALRFLNQPALAAQHFAAAAAAAETPISIARANYWRGRAAEALGQSEDAHEFYAKAAAYPIAYYGQLAARKLGASEIALRPPVTPAPREARAEAIRAVELYLSAGLEDFATPLAYAAAREWKDEANLSALAEVLQAKASASVNVVFGKLATERGHALDRTAFPTFGMPEFWALPGSAEKGQVMAVARQESEFITRAASGAGAKGLMQILPGTAADTARKAGVAFDYGRLVGDPAYNLQLGAAYLGQLIQAEGGSLEMAAAAYNAGAGRVSQWVAAYGDPRAGADLVDWVERIPYDETRDYVMRVAENYGVYRARLAEAGGAALARR